MRIKWWVILGLLFLVTGVAYAREVIQGEHCRIETNEVVSGTLFVLCQELIIEGRVEGNLIGVALRGRIEGEVQGSVYLLAGELDVVGQIANDLHFAGLSLTLQPAEAGDYTLGGNLLNASLTTTLAENTHQSGSFMGIGYQLLIDGEIDGEVSFWGSSLIVQGMVHEDVFATVGNPESEGSQIEPLLLFFGFDLDLRNPGLMVTSTGTIEGKLEYTGPVEGRIRGTVSKTTSYTSSVPTIIPLPEEGGVNIYLEQVIREFSTLFVMGILGLFLAPRLMKAPITNLAERPASSFSIGMLAFIASSPIALIILFLTGLVLLILSLLRLDGVLVAIGVLLGLIDFTVIGTFFFVAIFVARVIVCLALGQLMIRLLFRQNGQQRSHYLSLLIGVLLLSLAASLPVIGWIFNAASLFTGLGSIMMVLSVYIGRIRETSYAEVWYPQGAPPPTGHQFDEQGLRELPPPFPMVDDNNIGLDNLPAGFDVDFFWDDE